jgi:hypothetical protein
MAINITFNTVLSADAETRRGLYATTAQRLGTNERNVEKDLWVCLTLDILFNGLEPGGPRLLFKGGTSLSKAYGLIERFSEDIDVTVFRDDLGEPGTVEALAAMTGKKRSQRLDAIRGACRAYINGKLLEQLTAAFGTVMTDAGHPPVEIVPDPDDPAGQGLQVRYVGVTSGDDYIKPIVRIESGAKSALDPNERKVLKPYVAADVPGSDFSIPNVVTVDPRRTFWDKVVILHGLRRWYDIRGELRQEGQRISRHYYDLHRLLASDIGQAAGDMVLGEDCVRHAQMFFNRPDFDLASARPGSFALVPAGDMLDRLRRDYDAMIVMIFRNAPTFHEVVASVTALEARVNA